MINVVPTFENFEQGRGGAHESPKDYVASYKTHSGQNIIVKLSNWGEVTEDKRTYDERGFEIYESLAEVFKDSQNPPKEIIVKY